ncbi:crAss001_48 related protein [Paraburkholderia dilworthii]|uniref:crAss001_48 related protein n=1 Tax=Paraburkholderia dilworthii TaxID=948106 RepID=UPI000416C9AA|nr:hypothetical protein [Paraburkholderia dilworthii]
MEQRAYQPHQIRVLDEQHTLDLNRSKLKEFIDSNPAFAGLPDDERGRLIAQYRVMTEYSVILGQRIAAF